MYDFSAAEITLDRQPAPPIIYSPHSVRHIDFDPDGYVYHLCGHCAPCLPDTTYADGMVVVREWHDVGCPSLRDWT